MSKKITFVGAGSLVFTRNLVRDLLTFPAFTDAEICLMDIDDAKLDFAHRATKRIVADGNYKNVKVTATKDRPTALKGADGVLCTISTTPVEIQKEDILIPYKYGVDIVVGDTRGPAGIMRFLRTAPIMMEIVRDMEKYCPDAILLNYTNPMAMLCRLIQEDSSINATGLCHSVQHTSEMLARWIDAPMDEISYVCAGINHQAHYLRFERNGKDVYPEIREAILNRDEVYNEEQVRNELFLAMGYYVTESSGHASEYVPWFRKRKDLIEKYCTHGTGWNPGKSLVILDFIERRKDWLEQANKWFDEDFDLNRGYEYAAYIFNGIFGDNTPFEFNGNIRNFGIIDNLPYGCCIESPVIASRRGLEPLKVGNLPPQLALANSISAQAEEMAVLAHQTGDKELIYQAVAFDPLTSAVLSLKEIRDMVDEMFESSKDYLPQFKL